MAVETLLAEALLTLEEAKLYLNRVLDDGGVAIVPTALTVQDDELIVRMINYVTGQAELHTARKLKSRTYDVTNGYLYAEGEGSGEVDASEYPVTAVTAVEEMDSAGAVGRALNISGIRLDGGGLIRLPSDSFADGALHRIAGTAGIVPGTAQWKAITGAALRWLEVMYQDQRNHFGRGATISVGAESITPIDTPMPKDVARVFDKLRRIL